MNTIFNSVWPQHISVSETVLYELSKLAKFKLSNEYCIINPWISVNSWICNYVVVSIGVADTLVLKHQSINSHNTD